MNHVKMVGTVNQDSASHVPRDVLDAPSRIYAKSVFQMRELIMKVCESAKSPTSMREHHESETRKVQLPAYWLQVKTI